jgi:Na+-transporting methylmalonyl-CoA/oxaloacetate decarboxylase gamma subunit
VALCGAGVVGAAAGGCVVAGGALCGAGAVCVGGATGVVSVDGGVVACGAVVVVGVLVVVEVGVDVVFSVVVFVVEVSRLTGTNVVRFADETTDFPSTSSELVSSTPAIANATSPVMTAAITRGFGMRS